MFIIILVAGVCINSDVQSDPYVDQILFLIGSLFFLLWPLILGHELYHHVPKRITLNYTLFVVNGFLWIVADIILVFIFNGEFESNNGLVVFAMLYLVYGLFQYMSFPVKTLKTIETGKFASLGDYFIDFLLFIFAPVGIWFLQPRINKIVNFKPDDNQIEPG